MELCRVSTKESYTRNGTEILTDSLQAVWTSSNSMYYYEATEFTRVKLKTLMIYCTEFKLPSTASLGRTRDDHYRRSTCLNWTNEIYTTEDVNGLKLMLLKNKFVWLFCEQPVYFLSFSILMFSFFYDYLVGWVFGGTVSLPDEWVQPAGRRQKKVLVLASRISVVVEYNVGVVGDSWMHRYRRTSAAGRVWRYDPPPKTEKSISAQCCGERNWSG